MQYEVPYTLVRYSPDDLRGELFNVGVAVIAPPHLTLSLDPDAPQRLAPFMPAGQRFDLERLARGVHTHIGGALEAALTGGESVDLAALLLAAGSSFNGRVQFSAPGRIEFDCDEDLLAGASERIAQVILARCVRTEHIGASNLKLDMPLRGDALDQLEFQVHAPMPDWMRAVPQGAAQATAEGDLAQARSPSQRLH
jgi:hypothetical protein